MDGLLDHPVARTVPAAQPARMSGHRAIAAAPGRTRLDQTTQVAALDPLDPFAEPRIGTPLVAEVDHHPGRLRGGGDQSITAGEARGQWLLGVEVFPGRDRIAVDRLVEVAGQGDDDRVEVGPIQQPAMVIERLGPLPAGLLDDPLPTQPVLRLGVADRDDGRPPQLEQAPQ